MGDDMIKIVLIGLSAVFLSMLAGSIKREYSYLIALAASVLIFSYGMSRISGIVQEMRSFEESIGIDHEYVTILLKMTGIAYIGQFAVSLCRDAGQGAIAGQIGFVSKISMLVISIPVLEALVKTIEEFFS
jgi:stage III sporulation protein AD